MPDNNANDEGAQSETIEDRTHSEDTLDSDDEPMVHTTPQDYAAWARQERERLIAEGTNPKDVMLHSEIFKQRDGECAEDSVKRIMSTMEAVRSRGVTVLNDMCIADVKPDTFQVGGRRFVLGPKSGVTRGEYREFGEWFSRAAGPGDQLLEEVPEKFLKFEQPMEGDTTESASDAQR